MAPALHSFTKLLGGCEVGSDCRAHVGVLKFITIEVAAIEKRLQCAGAFGQRIIKDDGNLAEIARPLVERSLDVVAPTLAVKGAHTLTSAFCSAVFGRTTCDRIAVGTGMSGRSIASARCDAAAERRVRRASRWRRLFGVLEKRIHFGCSFMRSATSR